MEFYYMGLFDIIQYLKSLNSCLLDQNVSIIAFDTVFVKHLRKFVLKFHSSIFDLKLTLQDFYYYYYLTILWILFHSYCQSQMTAITEENSFIVLFKEILLSLIICFTLIIAIYRNHEFTNKYMNYKECELTILV